ncbi:MAG TPA: D-glycerate dehydrogenase [Nitrososphaera sp.]|nr:D-glycerate dehydrogenase [Nitrososphaera sp.]
MTRKFPGQGLERLSRHCDILLNNKTEPPSRKEILRNVRGKDGIICMLSDKIDAEVIKSAGPQLKVISSYSTGFDHIDVKEATSRGVYVTFTSDILAEATADLTFALILACARNIVDGDRVVRGGKWKVGWTPDLLLGTNVHGATLGIIGLGRIGCAVAKRAKGFGMNILYHNRNRDLGKELQLGAKYVELDDLYSQSDFVSVHTSLNKGSAEIINISALQKMKRSAFLINTSRGQVVNELDLARALKSKMIAGAGLDVFAKEPLPRKSPLVKMRNIVLLPHIGSATVQTRSRMGEVAVRNLLDVLEGKEPEARFMVNPKVNDSFSEED